MGVIGFDCEGRPIGLQGLGQLALLAEDVAQIVVSLEMPRLQSQGLPVRRHRVVEPAQVPQGVGQVVMDLGRVGHVGGGRAEFLDRLLRPPQAAEGIAPVVLRVARAGVELHRPLEANDRLVELLELGAGDTQLVVERGIAATKRGGLLQPLGGRWRIFALHGQEPQAIQGLAVLRIGLHDAAIPLFRLPPVSGLERAPCVVKFLHGRCLLRRTEFIPLQRIERIEIRSTLCPTRESAPSPGRFSKTPRRAWPAPRGRAGGR